MFFLEAMKTIFQILGSWLTSPGGVGAKETIIFPPLLKSFALLTDTKLFSSRGKIVSMAPTSPRDASQEPWIRVYGQTIIMNIWNNECLRSKIKVATADKNYATNIYDNFGLSCGDRARHDIYPILKNIFMTALSRLRLLACHRQVQVAASDGSVLWENLYKSVGPAAAVQLVIFLAPSHMSDPALATTMQWKPRPGPRPSFTIAFTTVIY